MKKKHLEDVLETFKQIGMYSVQFTFGEGVGCDDSDVSLEVRNIVLLGSPVGCLGETRVMFKGTMQDLMSVDFKQLCPIEISNPPKKKEYEKGGYFIWGTPDSVKLVLLRPEHINSPTFRKTEPNIE